MTAPCSSPRQPLLTSRLWICLFWKFHINGIIHIVAFVTSFFCLANVFKVYPHCSRYQHFVATCCQMTFHCMDRPHFFVHFISCFHLLAIVNNAAMNICVQSIVWMHVFNSLRYICNSGISGPYNSLFHIWGTTKQFSKGSVPFYIPASNCRRVLVSPHTR